MSFYLDIAWFSEVPESRGRQRYQRATLLIFGKMRRQRLALAVGEQEEPSIRECRGM
ncbi:hypothetical protein PENSPDRAFT_654375 [Peniophora sp. CONT]|nr:hypothetical protein PENSPDRAFT_654375 [Peniophora sp. CONT]